MKKFLLLAVILLLTTLAKADNKVYLQGYMYHNSTTHTITVQYWICNPVTGNPNIDIAALTLGLKWDTTVVSLTSYTFYPSGSGLDASDYLASKPDQNTSMSTTGKYKGINYQRSTQLCANLIHLGNNSCVPFFQATFTISSAIENNYDYVNSSASNYIASFSGFGPANAPIQFVPGSQFDDTGSSGSCSGTVSSTTSIGTSNTTDPTFSTSNGPLAVEWKTFNVYKQNNKAVLVWQTATEINNKGFEIQRKEGNAFTTIAFVPSKSADGNNSVLTEYSIAGIDLSTTQKTSYYRIKQISFDNKITYSEIRSINTGNRKIDLLIYPNPSHGTVNITIPSDFKGVDISIADYSGKTLKLWNNFSNQNITLNNLAKGFYLIKVQSLQTGEVITQKITVY